MRKKFTKRSLLTAALVMSALTLGNVAQASEYDSISDVTTLKNFITQNPVSVTTGSIANPGFKILDNIGSVTAAGLTLDGQNYYLDGSASDSAVATYAGFTVTKQFTMQNLTLKNMTSADGAAIYNNGSFMGKLTIDGTNTFSGNTATGNGGAIYNNNYSTIDVKGTNTFSGNTAAVNGGAIYNKWILNFYGTNTFSDNYAAGVLNDIYNAKTVYIQGGTTTLNGGMIQDVAGAWT